MCWRNYSGDDREVSLLRPFMSFSVIDARKFRYFSTTWRRVVVVEGGSQPMPEASERHCKDSVFAATELDRQFR